MKKKKRNKIFRAFLALVSVSFFLCIVDLWVSSNFLVTREFTVDLPYISGNTIRAVIISDLHDHYFGKDNKKLVNKIKRTQPDLILMDGDMLNENSDNANVPCSLVKQVRDIAPVYYALGNHEIEYTNRNKSDLIEQLEKAGAVILDKEYVDLDINGVSVRLGGMYDYAFGLDGNDSAMAAPEDVLSFLQDFQTTDRLKIMLAHRPESFVFGDASKTWDIDLVICGHVHGGQIVLPGIGGLYGSDQQWFPEYVHGLYEKDNLKIFITSGLGSNRQILPRFNNPPEIAVLNIALE